ncbi:MAG TPA: hypothetical protein VFA26_00060 [Gemmataceae bacterium]|nr:hypothetical protein [Gemmataceae bacterium]
MNREWVVFRKGWNAANQPYWGPLIMKVAKVEASSEEEALTLALERITVYNNQTVYAELASKVEAREARLDRKVKLL